MKLRDDHDRILVQVTQFGQVGTCELGVFRLERLHVGFECGDTVTMGLCRGGLRLKLDELLGLPCFLDIRGSDLGVACDDSGLKFFDSPGIGSHDLFSLGCDEAVGSGLVLVEVVIREDSEHLALVLNVERGL